MGRKDPFKPTFADNVKDSVYMRKHWESMEKEKLCQGCAMPLEYCECKYNEVVK